MMSLETPPMRLSAWGKTDKEKRWRPLAHHSMDVAAVFLRLMNTPVIANRLATAAKRDLTDTDRQRLAALAFLHDIGKLHPGFQAKRWPESLRPKRLRGHTSESYDFLYRREGLRIRRIGVAGRRCRTLQQCRRSVLLLSLAGRRAESDDCVVFACLCAHRAEKDTVW